MGRNNIIKNAVINQLLDPNFNSQAKHSIWPLSTERKMGI